MEFDDEILDDTFPQLDKSILYKPTTEEIQYGQEVELVIDVSSIHRNKIMRLNASDYLAAKPHLRSRMAPVGLPVGRTSMPWMPQPLLSLKMKLPPPKCLLSADQTLEATHPSIEATPLYPDFSVVYGSPETSEHLTTIFFAPKPPIPEPTLDDQVNGFFDSLFSTIQASGNSAHDLQSDASAFSIATEQQIHTSPSSIPSEPSIIISQDRQKSSKKTKKSKKKKKSHKVDFHQSRQQLISSLLLKK